VITEVKEKLVDAGKCTSMEHLLNKLIKSSLLTYEAPAHQLTTQLDFFESTVFLADTSRLMLKDLYHIKRKIDVIKRLLLLIILSVIHLIHVIFEIVF
jgi:magnesium transporter